MSQRVLIVDDDADIRHILGLRLRHAGFEIGEAADGAEGLAAVRASAWDIVLLDLMMPRVDGFAFLDELRGFATKPPVVVITQLEDPDSQKRAFALGATQYVPKRRAMDRAFPDQIRQWFAAPERGDG